jgi:hypothetical protein
MMGALMAGGRRHVDITDDLNALSDDGYIDVRERAPDDVRYKIMPTHILVEGEPNMRGVVNGFLMDDAREVAAPFSFLHNIAQQVAFKRIYKQGTDLDGRRIKILGITGA